MDLPGVVKAVINFGASNMIVEGDVEPHLVIREAAKEGVTAKPLGMAEDKSEDTFVQTHKDALTSGMSAVFLIVGWLAGLAGWEIAEIIAFILSISVGGYKSARSALYGIRKLNFDMNVLMTIAIIGAVALGEWTEGALVAIFFSLSNTLSVYTLEKARDSIRAMMGLAPKEATLLRNGKEVRLRVEEVQVNDIMLVKPGESLAMDGVVIKGYTTINQAAITGESMPVEKGVGSEVFAGTINQQGWLQVKVTKRVEDTTLAKIIHLVQEAQGKRAKSQAFIDQFAKYFTPSVIGLAVLVIVIPPLLFEASWTEWIYTGLALLIVACPCALLISTPVAILAGIGNAAQNGVLIKGGIFLEEAGSIKAIAFDKTGTLTVGSPEVTDMVVTEGNSEEQLLSISASLEKCSEHPLATAIVRYAGRHKISCGEAERFSAIIGKGAKGIVGGIEYYIGNPRLFEEHDADLRAVQDEIERLQTEGKTVMVVGTKEKVIGIIAVADEIRKSSRETIARLKEAGIERTIMLTGDNHATAQAIAEKLGVDDFRSGLLPEDKVEAIKVLQQKYGKIAMVGDGINDAPALATSNLGIAMGVAGTDAALETADIALMADDLSKLTFTIALSRATLRVIKQNIWFALTINTLAMLLIFPGWLTLIVAVLSDVLGALLVTLNGVRLLTIKPSLPTPY